MNADTLADFSFIERFYFHPVVSSTNDCARAMVEFPEKGIFVIQADRQTCGRGRNGASFFSATDSGLWVTLIVHLESIDLHFVHNRALSLSIAEAAEEVCSSEIVCTIKWPNDIFVNDRKLCGILLESHPIRCDMLVIGFGINVNTARGEFPDELQPIATSLFIEKGRSCSRSLLLQEIISRYRTYLDLDAEAAHGLYTRRLYRRGNRAEIESQQGIFEGVEVDGRLRLLGDHGVIYFHSGHLQFPVDSGSGYRG